MVPSEYPLMATAGGGLIGQSGISYGPNGSATGQSGDPSGVPAWDGQIYDAGASAVQLSNSWVSFAAGLVGGRREPKWQRGFHRKSRKIRGIAPLALPRRRMCAWLRQTIPWWGRAGSICRSATTTVVVPVGADTNVVVLPFLQWDLRSQFESAFNRSFKPGPLRWPSLEPKQVCCRFVDSEKYTIGHLAEIPRLSCLFRIFSSQWQLVRSCGHRPNTTASYRRFYCHSKGGVAEPD